MTLAFLVMRQSFLKHYAGVVELALERGFAVTLLCDHRGTNTPRRGPKSYEFPYLEALPRWRNGMPRTIAFASTDELVRALVGLAPHVLFAQGATSLLEELRRREETAGLFVAQVQTVPNPNVLVTPELFDVVYGFSPAWVEWTTEYVRREGGMAADDLAAFRKTLAAAYVPAGFAEAEQLRYIDRASVRGRLGLPPDRPVVLYLPFPFQSVRHYGDFWPARVYGKGRALQYLNILLGGRREFLDYARHGWNDRSVVAAARQFCDRHGALLVVKSRQKNPVPRHLARAADRVFYDDRYYPATILELLLAADLCVHFYSAALCEAVYAGVPSVCISPSPEEWPAYGRRMAIPDLSTAPGGFFNSPGVNWSVSVPDFIRGFGRAAVDDYPLDPGARRVFIERFLGREDVEVAARILADLEVRTGR